MGTTVAFAIQNPQVTTINITPVFDVLLVLLVIFMVATPLLDGPLALNLSSGHGTPLPVRELRLQIDLAGDYTLDGRTLSRTDLGLALRDAHARAPELRLRIAAADDSDYQAFVRALALAQQAGIDNIGSEMH
jgi:biopolymer transport protein ExbD